MIYFALVYPIILYGIEVYASTSSSNLNKIRVINNQLLRIALKADRRTPVCSLYISFRSLRLINYIFFKLFLLCISLFIWTGCCLRFSIIIFHLILVSIIIWLDSRTSNDLHLSTIRTYKGYLRINIQELNYEITYLLNLN